MKIELFSKFFKTPFNIVHVEKENCLVKQIISQFILIKLVAEKALYILLFHIT